MAGGEVEFERSLDADPSWRQALESCHDIDKPTNKVECYQLDPYASWPQQVQKECVRSQDRSYRNFCEAFTGVCHFLTKKILCIQIKLC